MKNLIGAIFLSCLLILGASSAGAAPFTIDLGAINTALGTNISQLEGPTKTSTIDVNIDLSVQTEGNNWATINQSFGDNGIFDDNDTFTEFGLLGVLSWDGSENIEIWEDFGDLDPTNDVQYKMYMKFDDLTGSISNYNGGTVDNGPPGTRADGDFETDIQDDFFDIHFDSTIGGSANIGIFLESQDYSATTHDLITLATLDVITGEGKSPELILDSAEGQFDLLLDFTSYNDVSDDVWLVNGMTFAAWEAMYPNSITMNTENLGATAKTNPVKYGHTTGDITDDGFIVRVENDGELAINAIPEPSTLFLFGAGLLGLAGIVRKRFF